MTNPNRTLTNPKPSINLSLSLILTLTANADPNFNHNPTCGLRQLCWVESPWFWRDFRPCCFYVEYVAAD